MSPCHIALQSAEAFCYQIRDWAGHLIEDCVKFEEFVHHELLSERRTEGGFKMFISWFLWPPQNAEVFSCSILKVMCFNKIITQSRALVTLVVCESEPPLFKPPSFSTPILCLLQNVGNELWVLLLEKAHHCCH